MMRSIFILLIVFVNLLVASELENQKYQLGLLAGIQSSYINNNHIINYNHSNLTFLPGLVFDYKFAENWSIRSGIHYSFQGGNSKDYPQTTESEPFGTGKYYWFYSSISYIEIPIKINYEFHALPVDLLIGAGPAWGYLISAYEGMDADFKIETDTRHSIESKLTKLNIMMNASVSTLFRISNNFSLEIGSNYSYGFIDIYKGRLTLIHTNLQGDEYTEEIDVAFKTRSVNFFTILKLNL